MRRIKLFESFKDKWPPCGPFSSMEEVDKVCDELRDMFVDFVDAGHYVKVQVHTKGFNEEKYDNKYCIAIGLSDKNRDSGGSYNTEIVSDSVLMACDYMKEYYDFDIFYRYFYFDKSGDHKKFESKSFFKKDVFSFFIIFREKL